MINRYAHLAPVLLRLALGAVFMVHGLPKLTSPDMVAAFFTQIGIPAAMIMTILVGVVETLGGLLLILGFGTRIAAGLLAVTMVVAIVKAKWSMGFVGGWEFELVLLAAALSLVLSGPLGERAQGEQSNRGQQAA